MDESHDNPALPSRARFDAVVIGAGPAGSMAAYTLAGLGRRVLLVERAEFPRAKVCGCCLAWRGVALLEQAGLGGVLEGAEVVDRLRLLDVGDADGSRRAVGAEIRVRASRVISRDVLDARLLRAACGAGAELVRASASAASDGVVGLTMPGGAACEVRASVVVAADGLAGSSVREVPGLAWRIDPASRMGCGAVLAREPMVMPRDGLVMIRGDAGYLGLARLRGGAIDAAAAFDPVEVKRAGGPGELAARFLGAAGGEGDVAREAGWKGTPALTRRREKVVSGRIVLAGDAASYVEPFTGEGMSWALMTGQSVAECADAALRGAGDAGLATWGETHDRLLRERHRSCGMIAAALRSGWIVSAAIRTARVCPPLARLAARWAVGGVEETAVGGVRGRIATRGSLALALRGRSRGTGHGGGSA